MIPTKRFEGLHEDFNVASENFTQIKDATSSVINAAGDFAEVSLEPIQSLLDQIKGLSDELKVSPKDLIEQATRMTKDPTDIFTDISKIPDKVFDGLLKSILPTGPGASAVNKEIARTMKTCKANAGRGLGLANKLPKPKCEGLSFGANSCKTSDTASLLNNVFNSDLTRAVNDLENALKKIISLASMGFAANLCGVFAAVTDGIGNKGVLTAAAGFLLNAEGKSGKAQPVMDISKSLTGINVKAAYPDTIKNIAENLTPPEEMGKGNMGKFSDHITAALEEIDAAYLGTNQHPSIAELGAKNPAMRHVLNWSGTDNDISVSTLNDVVSSKSSQVMGAYERSTFAPPSRSSVFLTA